MLNMMTKTYIYGTFPPVYYVLFKIHKCVKKYFGFLMCAQYLIQNFLAINLQAKHTSRKHMHPKHMHSFRYKQ